MGTAFAGLVEGMTFESSSGHLEYTVDDGP
jgi:hypothetical protein